MERKDCMLLPNWKKMVIKVGSALIAPDGAGCADKHMAPLARFITACRHRDQEVILVSSGAVAAGLAQVGKGPRGGRRSIPEKQALAALGQAQLMASWSRFFDFPCAQILLTRDDLHNRKRFVNAQNTLRALLNLGALPIVNENDSVAVDELKVGDNDNLAAHIAVLAGADLLLILSDVDGLYESNPRVDPEARLIPLVETIDDAIFARAGGSGSSVGTGGMRTKLEAAVKATARGINTVIANGSSEATMETLHQGNCPGTLFTRTGSPIAARKHWLKHALPLSGTLAVDGGAAAAMCESGASLLPSGLTSVRGNFQRGDAVAVVNHQGENLARGLVQYSAEQLQRIRGRRSSEITEILGFAYTDVIIHRGDMVMYEQPRALAKQAKNN